MIWLRFCLRFRKIIDLLQDSLLATVCEVTRSGYEVIVTPRRLPSQPINIDQHVRRLHLAGYPSIVTKSFTATVQSAD